MKMKKHLCTVYGLYDEQDRLRYIGQTRLSLERRKKWFYKGIRQAFRRGSKLAGNEFEIRGIDYDAIWDVSEVIYIDRYRQAGANLLNVAAGGKDSGYQAASLVNVGSFLTGDKVDLQFDGKYLATKIRTCLSKQDFWSRLAESEQEDTIWSLVDAIETIS